LLVDWMFSAGLVVHRQGDRLGNANHGELALDSDDTVTIENQLVRLEGDRRVLRNVEEVLALDVFVESGIDGLDRSGIDRDVDPRRVCGAVELDRAGGFSEGAALDREAHVPHLEVRLRMHRVDLVGLLGGTRAGGDHKRDGRKCQMSCHDVYSLYASIGRMS